MPTKRQELVVEITADADKAEASIKALTKAAQPLEEGVEVRVKATGADKAADELGKAATAGKALDKAVAGIDPVHVRDVGGPAALAAQAFDKVADEAEQAAKAIADIKAPAGLDDPLPNLKPKLDDASHAADGARNAMANLAGNTAQDMGSMLGPLGSVGVAIGQITEYTADARLGGESMGKALAGAASMAGPLAALSIATLAATNAIERHKARQAELVKISEELVQSFLDGTGVVEEFGDSLDEAFSAGTASNVQTLTKLLSDRLDPKEFNRVATAFGELGLNMEDLGDIIPAVDENFQAFAATQLKQAGLSDQQAAAAARLIDKYDQMTSLSGDLAGKSILGDSFSPEQVAKIDKVTHGLQELADQAQNVELQKVATDALNAARAFDEAGVAAAEAGGGLPLEQYARYTDAQNEAAKAAEDQARASEEGAKAAADSGTILDQVGRQVADAADLAADAMDKAKAAQDNWLTHNVDYEASVDGFTESLQKLTEQTEKQAKAGDDGAGSFEGNTKAALDNRDALRDVYTKATDVIQGMKDAGFSVDGARTAQDNMAQSAYDLAIQMGLPIGKAEEIRDRIKEIPPSVTSDVVITEQGYADVKAKQDALDRDMQSTVYINGVVDRQLQDFIRSSGFGAAGGTITPASAPAGRSAAPVALVPVAPTAMAAPVSRSQSVNVNVNLSGGIVADTFELQRVVERAARAGARLGGTRP
jgi:hypothetical protein